MQDSNVPAHKDGEKATSLRLQRLVEHLENLWQGTQKPSFETLKQIIGALPEPYRGMGISAIAERLTNDFKLHFLTIIATFYEKAEQEGIDAEERDEILQDARPEATRLMQLSKQVAVHSLDDLLALGNITSGLRKLSPAKDAASAQSWMYKLPSLYHSRLEQKHLIEGGTRFTVSIAVEPHYLSSWHTTVSEVAKIRTTDAPEDKSQERDALQAVVSGDWNKLLPKPIHVSPQVSDATLASLD